MTFRMRTDMYAKLHDAGCMHEVSALGIDKDTVELTLQSSPYVRNRLTLLRLAIIRVVKKLK